MVAVILAIPMLLLFVLNGAYILYRFSASKIKRSAFIIFGLVTGLLPVVLVALMDQSSWFIFLLELILYILFLQYFRSKNLRTNVFLSIFTLTFCYFVKMFISIFVVEHLFRIKDGAIGGVIGDLCVIPAYFLLLKCLTINPKYLIIADQEWEADYLDLEDNPKGSKSERDIEQEQNRLIIFSDILMILFYLYNNFVRLTDFGSRFNFNYVVFVYVFLFLGMLYSINVKYKEWENQKLHKYKDYLLSGLATYTKEVDKSYQSVRMFRHDFTNILVSMRETIETQEIEAVRKTYGEILERSRIILDENRREVTKLGNLKVL